MINTCKRKLLVKSVPLVCAGLLAGCATVNLPSMTEKAYQPEDDEARLFNRAREAVTYIHHSGSLYHDPALEQYLNSRLALLVPPHIYSDDLEIKVEIMDDPLLNAFTVSNGRMFINTGLIAAVDTEDQIMTILSHELVHVLNRHFVKQKRNLDNRATFFNATFGGVSPLLVFLGTATSASGFSRLQEKEADMDGVTMLTHLGYDLNESAKVYQTIDDFYTLEGIKLPFFFASHPKLQTRIENIRAFQQEQASSAEKQDEETSPVEAQPPPARPAPNQERFQALKKDLFASVVEEWISEGYYEFAAQQIETHLSRHPESARGYFLKGELFRQRFNTFNRKYKKEINRDEDFKTALAAYDHAIALDARLASAFLGKGRVLTLMNKEEEAAASFRQYLTLNPDAEDRAYIERYLRDEE